MTVLLVGAGLLVFMLLVAGLVVLGYTLHCRLQAWRWEEDG